MTLIKIEYDIKHTDLGYEWREIGVYSDGGRHLLARSVKNCKHQSQVEEELAERAKVMYEQKNNFDVYPYEVRLSRGRKINDEGDRLVPVAEQVHHIAQPKELQPRKDLE